MSGSSQFEYSKSESSERSSAYGMLKARFPTQRELAEIYRELDSLKKDKKLKDDTIKFLQKEKEGLMRELKHYEQLCEGVVSDITSHRELEAENAQLNADILHLKDVIRRQNSLLRATGTSGNTQLDRQLVTRLCTNLLALLSEAKTTMSSQVYKELEHQKEVLERSNPKRGDTTWQLLEIIDRAMIELSSVPKRNHDLPDIGKPTPPLKYSQTNPLASPDEESRRPQSNLMSTNSTSMANLSVSDTLQRSGYQRSRPNNPGKLGKLGKLERSRSAPSLNGMIPRPPPCPAPSNIRNVFESQEAPLTAKVNMLDTLSFHPPGL
ncbi:uncharacterized protein [Watersipora subatra]|uniref:uncharacterized protein n=1 Tax=Watersipora subatra TaxID=2589382 RepID=UPI00355C4554